MRDQSTGLLFLAAISVAGLHALIPSHWLAFALVGRAERWPIRKTVGIAAATGLGHVAFTLILGAFLSWIGKELIHSIPEAAEHAGAGGALVLLGVFFIRRAKHGEGGCGHDHTPADNLDSSIELHDTGHDHSVDLLSGRPEPAAQRIVSRNLVSKRLVTKYIAPKSKRVVSIRSAHAIGGLVLGMTLSPCLDLLSVYIPALLLPLRLIIALSCVMASVTVSVMALLVWLTLHGMERLNLKWLQRNEGAVIGGVLIVLGVLLFVVPT